MHSLFRKNYGTESAPFIVEVFQHTSDLDYVLVEIEHTDISHISVWLTQEKILQSYSGIDFLPRFVIEALQELGYNCNSIKY